MALKRSKNATPLSEAICRWYLANFFTAFMVRIPSAERWSRSLTLHTMIDAPGHARLIFSTISVIFFT